MPPKKTEQPLDGAYQYINERTLPRWTRNLSTSTSTSQTNTDLKAHKSAPTVKSSLPGSGAEEDWECISEQSCQENSGNGEAVGRNGKNLSPEYNQTRRKLEQSEVNRTIAAKSKEREARKAEL